jgi:hypothetical protein
MAMQKKTVTELEQMILKEVTDLPDCQGLAWISIVPIEKRVLKQPLQGRLGSLSSRRVIACPRLCRQLRPGGSICAEAIQQGRPSAWTQSTAWCPGFVAFTHWRTRAPLQRRRLNGKGGRPKKKRAATWAAKSVVYIVPSEPTGLGTPVRSDTIIVVEVAFARSVIPFEIGIARKRRRVAKLFFRDVRLVPPRLGSYVSLFHGMACSCVPIPRNPPNDRTAYATRPLIFSIISRLMLPILLPLGS